ncbi:MAG TPA: hypothetical protein VFW65_07880 [Pseudonocardiaceae bacterium]|nr:hypothetical protein [Pseudonocardiaceae bacterium]
MTGPNSADQSVNTPAGMISPDVVPVGQQTGSPVKYRADREIDTLPLTVLLTRLVQVMSGTVLKMAEPRAEGENSLGAHLCALADETEWVSNVLRSAALAESAPNRE